MSSCNSNMASGMASGMLLGMVLGSVLEEAEPIDFKCMKCSHSFSKHNRNGCDNGVFNKCGCRKFELNEGQIVDAEKDISELRSILFEHLEAARELQS